MAPLPYNAPLPPYWISISSNKLTGSKYIFAIPFKMSCKFNPFHNIAVWFGPVPLIDIDESPPFWSLTCILLFWLIKSPMLPVEYFWIIEESIVWIWLPGENCLVLFPITENSFIWKIESVKDIFCPYESFMQMIAIGINSFLKKSITNNLKFST